MTAVATLPASSPSPLFSDRASIPSFKGDDDLHVDALITACQRREVPKSGLKHRELVPYFDGDADGAPFAMLQERMGRCNNQVPRRPPQGKKALVQGARGQKNGASRTPSPASQQPVAAPASDVEMQTAKAVKRHAPKPSKTKKHSHGGGDSSGSGSDSSAGRSSGSANRPPPHKRQEQGGGVLPATPVLLSMARFAGPAFTNSPPPGSLPLPPSSLLCDGVAMRLQL